MPKKGHRAASRQAQLSRKKKRGRGGKGQQFEIGPLESESTIATAVEIASEDEEATQEASGESEATQPQATTQAAPATTQPARRPQQSQRATNRRAVSQAAARRARQRATVPEPASLTYKYLTTELKQIGIWSSLIVAILIGLTFALRP